MLLCAALAYVRNEGEKFCARASPYKFANKYDSHFQHLHIEFFASGYQNFVSYRLTRTKTSS